LVEKLIAIGVSLGGFDALPTLIGGLSRDLAAACVIVQHRPPDDDSILDRMLGQLSGRTVREPDHHEAILTGSIYLAPANYHLLVDGGHFSLSTEGRVLFARPSIDVFFASASECYEERVIAVCMTGSSRDGALGAQAVHRRGGLVLVHDPKTARSPVAPRAALETVPKALVLQLEELAPKLNELCGTVNRKGVRPGAQ
jgi:two-component system chemotaxis response regulator CheB